MAVFHASAVERTSDDVVADTGKVFYSASPDENNRVFLQVMADARNVRGNFDAVSEPYAGDFAKSRVGLLGCDGIHTGAHSPASRVALQCR